MIRFLDRVNEGIQRILQAILILFSVAVLLINLAQIGGRNLFFYSLPWSEQLSTCLFIWSIFLGFHLVVQEDGELTIDVIHFKSERMQLGLQIFRDVCSLFMIFVFFASSVQFFKGALLYPQKLSSLPLNMYVIYGIMPVSFFLIALQKFTNLAKRIANMRTSGKDSP